MSLFRLCILVFVLVLGGCASIVSKSRWPFSVMTEPSGAKVVITDQNGNQVFIGKTPAALKLKSGDGFFKAAGYKVAISLDGYETKTIDVKCTLNGWYFGNIVFGGLIGLLIVDPITGAMYRLKSEGISLELDKTKATTSTKSLKIMEIDAVPVHLRHNLVRLN